ncbi:DinB family protein [Micromonospora sp. WMMD710]|uniref:DinB family protein n=1 Tax=Micromonospora sp. WMMD710 TaxID=3016085 RepID=UPI0024160DED|nr:DinB family protein [Micromonospora sp. WMMD710]MDG4759928.1 DinB family protein [Micromonospora sp. WMMD710]
MTRRSGSDAESGAEPHISGGEPTRVFGWSTMFVHSGDDPRSGGNFADERTVLVEFLRNQRLTLERKCDGLDAEQLARRSVPPSTMSLLGLIRHMAEVERGWFRRTMAGQEAPQIYCSDDDPDGDFDGALADPAVVDEARRAWRAEVEFAERFVAEAPDLEVQGRQRKGNVVVLRELLVHMIEEYARHNGHADLLRERIDGRVGL